MVFNLKTKKLMDQSDIHYILDLLKNAISEKEWDQVEEAKETLKEFLDEDPSSTDE